MDAGERSCLLALSELFLDTELDPHDLQRIAGVLADRGVDVERARRWLEEDVAPVCGPNLFGVAGAWAGFDEAWLAGAVARGRRRPAWLRAWRRCGGRAVVRAAAMKPWARIADLLASAERDPGELLDRATGPDDLDRVAFVVGRRPPAAVPTFADRLAPWLEHADADVRDRALDVLEALPEGGAADARLLDRRRDPSPALRARVARGLGARRQLGALRDLLDDPDPRVRYAVAAGLAEALAPGPLPGWLVDAARSASPRVRHVAAQVLMRVHRERGDGAELALLRALSADPDEDARAAAAAALTRAAPRDPASAASVPALAADPSAEVRGFVASALGDAAGWPEATPLLRALLRDPSPQVVGSALFAAERAELVDALRAEIVALSSDPEHGSRARAVLRQA